jgi:hypothetical protein
MNSKTGGKSEYLLSQIVIGQDFAGDGIFKALP